MISVVWSKRILLVQIGNVREMKAYLCRPPAFSIEPTRLGLVSEGVVAGLEMCFGSPAFHMRLDAPHLATRLSRVSNAKTSASGIDSEVLTQQPSHIASMSQSGDGVWDDTHRAFLQHLLAKQTTTFTEARPLLAAIQTAADPNRPTLANDISREDFDNYIDAINTSLSPFDLEVRRAKHQVSKDEVYALVNTQSDALTQMATSRSADEIAFVKRILDAMFETYNTQRAEVMAIMSMRALKLAKPAGVGRRDSGATQTQAANAGLTMSQAEKVLGSLVAEGWFELSQRGFYSLSPRALMELRGWLIETYNDQVQESDDEDEEEEPHQKIKFCQACKEIVTVGQRCPNLACNSRLHNHCVSGMFRAQGGNEQCPICKTAWQDPPAVGEKAARKQRQSNGTGGSRRTTGGSSNVGMDGAGDSDSDAAGGAD